MADIELTGLASYATGRRRALTIKDGVVAWGAFIDDLTNYGGDLATAATDIGATDCVLHISEPYTLAADVDLSATGITLKFINDGKITVNSGKTLTVGAIEPTGNRQIFAGAGTVLYAGGSANLINLAWRAGNATNADVTTALNEAITSIDTYGGVSCIYVPQLAPQTDGGHDVVNSFYLFGNGNYTSGTNGYGNTLRLKSGTTEAYMFKIGEGIASVRFSNIVLDADGVTGKDGVLVEGDEGAGTTVADVVFEKVTFDSFRYGVNHNSTSGAHQWAQVSFKDCIFQSCTTAGLRTNSVNESLVLINTNFAVPSAKVGWQNDGSGAVTLLNCEFAGGGSTSKAVVISAAHGAINFIAYQDENFGTSLQNDASDITGIINYMPGCLIQGKIQLNQSCKVNIHSGCNIMSYAIQGAATGAVVNVQEGVNIREVSVNDGTTVVSPAVLLGAGSGVQILTENLSDLGVFKQRIPQQFISPLSALGAASTPVMGFAHITNGTDEDKVLLRLGRQTTAEAWDYYYDIFRKHSDGWLHFEGNQSDPNKGFYFNSEIKSKTPEVLIIPVSDESTDLTTGTAKITFRMPYAFHLTAVRSSVNTAPTGSTLIVDINEGGTTILSTKLSIDASEKTSVTAATAAVISDADLADDAEITIDIDQIGSTVAGKGLKVTLIGYRT